MKKVRIREIPSKVDRNTIYSLHDDNLLVDGYPEIDVLEAKLRKAVSKAQIAKDHLDDAKQWIQEYHESKRYVTDQLLAMGIKEDDLPLVDEYAEL